NIVATPGVFGFIMAALTAALMSTVDTLINATAAIYINDVYRPIEKFIKRGREKRRAKDKRELSAARYASIAITSLGVASVLAFKNFPTVYEAHGYFHSTLTPPLVVAIFLGLFWKKFTPSAVITSFVAGVALMILGLHDPNMITPFAHGIEMNPDHPYSYIRALYNLIVVAGVAVLVTLTTSKQKEIVQTIRSKSNEKEIIYSILGVSIILFLMVLFGIGSFVLQFLGIIILIAAISIITTYYVKYDEVKQTEGLTVWSLAKAKEIFKGRKVNDREGEIIKLNWKMTDDVEDIARFSKNDMEKMKAEVGDLVYICDARKYLGGLKSVHSTYGEPHDEDGVVYINNEH
ncbi:MAG: sodium:solute symporter family protein, partial [Melioribacteraceae bacterium]|nr:sodium:solute symporter family protein [Melioribacteraceae bacterium]